MFDDPALKASCERIDFGTDLSWLKNLRKTCSFTENGVGLAAPQIGILKQACFIWPGRAGMGEFLVNPEITFRSNEVVDGEEGCLSYPGVFIRLSRAVSVTVEYFDHRWMRFTRTFRDMEARIVLHEMDHLRGVCYVGDAWRKSKGGAA